MKDFLKIGKDLQIKEIKEVPEEEEMVDIAENMAEKPHHDLITEALWHKVDISIFQWHKNVNFCNIFVG